MYIEVERNYEKCQVEVMNVSQVANDFRSFIQQAWGGCVNLARKREPGKYIKIQHIQHKKGSHRKLVAESISKTTDKVNLLNDLLSKLYELYSICSTTNFGKSILANDLEKLKKIHRKLILQITDLIGMVNLR